MRYLYINLAAVLSAMMALSSCNSFLDETPDNRLRLDSYEKIAELVTNAYPEGSGVFMEWMSDNVGADPKNIQRSEMTQAYNWQDVEQEGQDTPAFYWSGNYKAIAHANEALKALEEVKENNRAIRMLSVERLWPAAHLPILCWSVLSQRVMNRQQPPLTRGLLL